MSTFDPFASIAAEFDKPVAPRTAFAVALAERLESELRATASKRSPDRRWRTWLSAPGRPRSRLLIASIILLLLLTGVATANFLGVRTWISSSPRGAQVTSNFSLSRVFSSPRSAWMDTYPSAALSPDGHDLYMTRVISSGGEELLRIRGVDTAAPSAATVLLDLRTVPDHLYNGRATGGLSTSPNGDLFVLGAADGASIVVVHPNGTHATVATQAELSRAGVPGVDGNLSISDLAYSVVATADNRLWLRAMVLRHRCPCASLGTNALFTIVDPNADGNWSDRVIRRIALPATVSGFQPHADASWIPGPLVAEPSSPGDDRSHSVLIQESGFLSGAAASGGHYVYRVYRVADLNDDGDALDPGEARLLLTHRVDGLIPRLGARIGTTSGGHVRQLVIGGLTRPDTISIVSDTGSVSDIGRAFPSAGDYFDFIVLASRHGDIYTALVFDQGAYGSQRRIYRLHPISGGSRPSASTGFSNRAMQPTIMAPHPGTGPLLSVSLAAGGSRATATMSYWVRPDGAQRQTIAAHVGDLCQASTGKKVAFTSDAVVPQEPFVYVGTPGSKDTRRITTEPLTPVCPFDGRRLILASREVLSGGTAWTLVRHDLHTGREAELIRDTPHFSVSPSGDRIAYVAPSSEGGQTLDVLDVRTQHQHVIAGPLHGSAYAPGSDRFYDIAAGDLLWSRDGTQLAFVTGRPSLPWEDIHLRSPTLPRTFRIWVAPADGTASPDLVRTVRGGPPSLSWSADGDYLLACTPDRGSVAGCVSGNWYDPSASDTATLQLIDVRRHTSRVVATGSLLFAAWAPIGDRYAYADYSGLSVGSPGHQTRVVAAAPLPNLWSKGTWVGWSPDGTAIALGPADGYAVVDLRTGRQHRLVADSPANTVKSVSWWRR